jgi:hypothetical protein
MGYSSSPSALTPLHLHQHPVSMTAQIECTGISFGPYTIIPSIRLKPLDDNEARNFASHSPFNHYLLHVARQSGV